MKKRIAAIAALVLAVVLTFSLASCKKITEDDLKKTIDNAIKAFTTLNEKDLKKYAESSVADTMLAHLDLIPGGDKIYAALLDGMTYEIGDITIDEDPQGVEKNVSATATAKITFTAKNLKTKASVYQLTVYSGAISGKLNLTDKTYLETEAKRVLEVINGEDIETVSTPITLNLEKRGGKWVAILTGAPQNTMLGGAGSALNQVVSYVVRAAEGGSFSGASGESQSAA